MTWRSPVALKAGCPCASSRTSSRLSRSRCILQSPSRRRWPRAACSSQYFRRGPQIHKKGLIDLVTDGRCGRRTGHSRACRAPVFPEPRLSRRGSPSVGAGIWNRPFRWIMGPHRRHHQFRAWAAVFSASRSPSIEGRVEVGVVYAPVGDELFTAERGEGTRLNGMRIHVTREASLIDTLLVTGFPASERRPRRAARHLWRVPVACASGSPIGFGRVGSCVRGGGAFRRILGAIAPRLGCGCRCAAG